MCGPSLSVDAVESALGGQGTVLRCTVLMRLRRRFRELFENFSRLSPYSPEQAVLFFLGSVLDTGCTKGV